MSLFPRREELEVEVQRTLVLSTGHIPRVIAAALELAAVHQASEEQDELVEGICFDNLNNGWALWVNEDGEIRRTLPPEIQAIYAFADLHDCTWVKLDADGPRMADLPYWEW